VEKTVIGAVGSPDADKTAAKESLEQLPFVEQVILILQPYKLVARAHHPEGSVISVDGVPVGGSRIAMMAGPCTVETYDQVMVTAKAVKEAGATILRGGAYKPSTSPYSFQGLGKEGLEILGAASRTTPFPRRLDLDRVRRVYLRGPAYQRLYADVERRARAAGRIDIAEAVAFCRRRSRRLKPAVTFVTWLGKKRGLWRLARRLRPAVLGESIR
jgi:hypothetical protein